MSNMHDLGLEHIEDTSNYDELRARIYEYYGATDILNTGPPQTVMAFNFPLPLDFTGKPTSKADTLSSMNITTTSCTSDKEQFFKHLLRPDVRTLLPFVDAILDLKHKNSPIFIASSNLNIDRESLAQLVDRVYHLAITQGITPNSNTRALINALMLMELLVWRNENI